MAENTLAALGAAALLAVGGAVQYNIDRLPPIGFTIPIPLWHPRIELPPSLGTKLVLAVAAERSALDGVKTCRATMAGQTAAVRALAAQSRSDLVQAERVISQTRGQVARLEHGRAGLVAALAASGDTTPATVCLRWRGADEAVKEALQ